MESSANLWASPLATLGSRFCFHGIRSVLCLSSRVAHDNALQISRFAYNNNGNFHVDDRKHLQRTNN